MARASRAVPQQAPGGPSRLPVAGVVAIVGLMAGVGLGLGLALQPLAVDDAFISYRYAQNLAQGQGFTYNQGRPVLSTTAPLWALILTAGSRVWPDLPLLANALSAAALGAAGLLVFALGRREGSPWVGALTGLLFVAHPLLWLSLGLETALFLALGLSAIAAYRGGRLNATAILLALATLTRGDGLILAAVIAADCIGPPLFRRVLAWFGRWRARQPQRGRGERVGAPEAGPVGLESSQARGACQDFRRLLGAAVLYVATMLPLLAWLTWQFGSPLPATLGAKVAQSELGVTGFYAHTTYLEGLGILARARLDQSPLYFLFLPALVAGLLSLRRGPDWVRLLVTWGAAHLVGYTLLGVTPYYWYYAPLVLALAALAALGIVASARWIGRRLAGGRNSKGIVGWVLGGVWAAALVLALFWSDWALVRALDGPVPRSEEPVSKVLPEAKGHSYREAGLWLRHHTPREAVVGVTEVGIMGYYSERTMVDFLGLLEPEVADALARGDLYWALLRYQPDYLALTAISPLYAYDLRADPWFQAAYQPVQAFDDPRFWGSPVTVYERSVPRALIGELRDGEIPPEAIRLDTDLGPVRLLGAVVGEGPAHPGDVLALTLYWEAREAVPSDYTVFTHLLGRHDRVIAQRDSPPGLGAQPTSRWVPGRVVADPYLLALPDAAYAPDTAVWEVGLYDPATGRRLRTPDGRDNVRFGAAEVRPSPGGLDLNFGPVTLTGYDLDRLALLPGEALRVSMRWVGAGAARIYLRLVGEDGTLGVEVSGSAEDEEYELTMGLGVSAGAYDLEVGVRDPVTAAPLPLLGADGQPRGDSARLTKVRVYP